MNNQQNRMDSDEVVIDLARLARAVWRKAWLVLLAAVLVGVSAYAATAVFISPTYRSSFTAYINNKSGTESTTLTNSDLLAAQSLVNTYSAILISQPVLEDAAAQAGLIMTYEELSAAVSTSTVDDTEIIQINVTMEDPQMALDLAQALVDIAPGYVSKIVEGSSMQVVAPPVLPDKIYAPNYKRNAAIGVILGAVLVIAVVVITELVDNRVKSESELEERYGIAVMGVIPDLVEAKKKNYAYSYQ